MSVAAATDALPDIQATGDSRGVGLDAVGITGVVLPATVLGPDGTAHPTVAELELAVSLEPEIRGTHMSRLIEEGSELSDVTPASLLKLATTLCERLDGPGSCVSLRFPLFVRRPAPVTGLAAPHRYEAWLSAEVDRSRRAVRVGVRAPVTSLCPCSREISDYGAHSQRGYVEVEVEAPGWLEGASIWPQELFDYADQAGSAPIYPLLKRADERAVTMLAYDQPAFVEDIAREVVLAVAGDVRCAAWEISVINQESIHDHQAVARVRGRR